MLPANASHKRSPQMLVSYSAVCVPGRWPARSHSLAAFIRGSVLFTKEELAEQLLKCSVIRASRICKTIHAFFLLPWVDTPP